MRVRGGAKADPSRERGVVAVIVALLLVVLIASLAIAIDGGLLFVKYRSIRTANDAAALAAAYSCGKGEGFAAAESQADLYATDNVAGPRHRTADVYDPSCDADSGQVTVNYEADQQLYFGPAVGLSSPRSVTAAATASWGGAGGASQVAPLMLSSDRLSNCNIPSDDLIVDVSICVFWWNNGPDYSGSGTWGLMNLDTWGVDPAYNCQAPGLSSYRNWLLTGYPGALGLKDPGPTYVCADPGSYGNALDNAIDQAIDSNAPYAFPVAQPSAQLPCPPTCKPDKYAVIGFAWLQMTGLYTIRDAEWDTYCASVPGIPYDSNTRCLVSVWKGYSTSPIVSQGSGENFGIVQVWLSG